MKKRQLNQLCPLKYHFKISRTHLFIAQQPLAISFALIYFWFPGGSGLIYWKFVRTASKCFKLFSYKSFQNPSTQKPDGHSDAPWQRGAPLCSFSCQPQRGLKRGLVPKLFCVLPCVDGQWLGPGVFTSQHPCVGEWGVSPGWPGHRVNVREECHTPLVLPACLHPPVVVRTRFALPSSFLAPTTWPVGIS